MAASAGGGVSGYIAAYLSIGGMAVVLVVLTLGLKNRHDEQKHINQLQPAGTQAKN